MGEHASETTDGANGVDEMTLQSALYTARTEEGDLRIIPPAVIRYLEDAVAEIWSLLLAEPDSYIMTKDEFAVFNYFVQRYTGSDVAEKGIARFWLHHRGDDSQA